jgi:hypothetical protein
MDGPALTGESPSQGRKAGVVAEEDYQDAGLSVFMIAPEETPSRKKMVWLPVLLIIMILFAIAIPILKGNFQENPAYSPSNINYEISPPSFREDAFVEMEAGTPVGSADVSALQH